MFLRKCGLDKLRKWALLGLCFFLSFCFIWFYGQKRVIDYFTIRFPSELEKKVKSEINIEKFSFRFPNQLRLQGVSGRGEDFSFFVSRAILQWDWRYFFGASPSEKAFYLFLEEVELSSSQKFLQKLPSFSLSFLPPGEIKIKKIKSLQFSGEEVSLRKDREGKLSLGISLPSGRVEGIFREGDNLHFNFNLVSSNLPFQGEVYWDMKDGKVEGKVSSPYNLSFKAILSFTEENMVFSPLELWETEENRCLFRGEGKIKNDLSFLEGEGEIYLGEEKNFLDIAMDMSLSSPLFRGKFSLWGNRMDIKGGVSFLERSVLAFNIDSGSSFEGLELKEEMQAITSWEKGNIEINILDTLVKFNRSLDWEGEGNFQGVINKEGQEWKGHLTWRGGYLQMGDFLVSEPLLNVELGQNGKTVLYGEGNWGGGKITLSGEVFSGHLSLQGDFQSIEVEHLVEGMDFPLKGWVSGEWKREEDKSIFLSLKEGKLFWEDWCLGAIEKGEIEFSPSVLIFRDLYLRHGEGVILGNLEKKRESWEGEIEVKDYPVSYSLEEENIELSLNGNVVVKSEDLFLSLFSPFWKIGKMEGKEFSLAGKVEDGGIEIEDFSCDWEEGHLFLKGKVDPYREVNLKGEIQNLEIPSYWDIEGNLEKIFLSLSGSWDEVIFLIEGEGKNFFWQGEPWGDYFHLLLRGKAPLPRKGETSFLTDYLNPQLLQEGTIEVRGINLEQLMGKAFSYPVSGMTDVVINLDTQKNLWFFYSERLSFVVQDFHFQGKLEGNYDGEDLVVNELFFQELTGGLEVGGSLKWEGKTKTLVGEIKGKVDRSFSIPYGVLQLRGEANIAISGDEEKPLWQGEVEGEGEIWREGKKYADFNNVRGIIKEGEIQLGSGSLHIAGLNWIIEGVISREESEIHLSGGGKLEIPEENVGLSRVESNVVIRACDGIINLQGEAKIFDGWGDFTKGGDTENYSSLLSQLEEKLEELPLSLELTLYTANKLRVKTRFLDLEMEGRLKIWGGSGRINGEGKLEVVEGNYDLVLRKIPIRGYITFSPLYGLNPRVNLYGEEEIGGYHIFLEAMGPVDNYKLILKSEPLLEEEEILSLLFLGEKDAYLSLDNLNWQPLLWKLGQFLLGKDFFSKGGLFDGVEIKFPGSDYSDFYGLRLEKSIGENYFIGYTQDLSGEGNSSWDFKINFDKEWSLKMEGDTEGEINWMIEFNTKF